MRKAFKQINFKPDKLEMISACNCIIQRYQEQDLCQDNIERLGQKG